MNSFLNGDAGAAVAVRRRSSETATPQNLVDDRSVTANQDLTAALQLLAERACFLTAASSVVIALGEGAELNCKAHIGSCDPSASLVFSSALIRETLKTRRIVCCDDVLTDSRLDRLVSGQLGVKSVLVVPVIGDDSVLGVFELQAERAQAFEDRDVIAITRLAELAVTAIEAANAAQRKFDDVKLPEIAPAEKVEESEATQTKGAKPKEPDQRIADSYQAAEKGPSILDSVRACPGCGFPISGGRSVCLDCEEAGKSVEPLTNLLAGSQQNWLQAHFYTIAAILMVAATAGLLVIKFR